jgi:uncharacterized membrane protein
MKKILIPMGVIAFSLLMVHCGSSRKAATATASKSTFSNEINTVVQTYCTPCHVPSKGGKKKAYDVYANVKEDIDEIIRRIELSPDQKGFMPFKKSKLDEATIAVFKKWKEDGMME